MVEQAIYTLEAQRDLTRVWLHVDMDAFFASVEELFAPQLVGYIGCHGIRN